VFTFGFNFPCSLAMFFYNGRKDFGVRHSLLDIGYSSTCEIATVFKAGAMSPFRGFPYTSCFALVELIFIGLRIGFSYRAAFTQSSKPEKIYHK
jgi:hypothetical protein